MGTVAALWHEYAALWAWAISEGGVTPLALTLVITVFGTGLLAATGYGIWLLSTNGADAVLRFWEGPGRHLR